MGSSVLSKARSQFLSDLTASILKVDPGGVPTNADKDSGPSVRIASELAARLGVPIGTRQPGQTAGTKFEEACVRFLEATWPAMEHMRPGDWSIDRLKKSSRVAIAAYDQYAHLQELDSLVAEVPVLATLLGNDYLVAPDIVIVRHGESDSKLNERTELVDNDIAKAAPLRRKNHALPILHASISCKWTIRSDRAQNARSEALNLIRNRKGNLPHISIVTAEPTPGRIASLALGTGDVDCVYHIALYELIDAVAATEFADSRDLLGTMIDGRRLRDISDLPLDLAI